MSSVVGRYFLCGSLFLLGFYVIGDLLECGEPDAGLGLHVKDQLLESRDARAMSGDVRMHGENKHGVFLVGHVELALVHIEDQLRIGRTGRQGKLSWPFRVMDRWIKRGRRRTITEKFCSQGGVPSSQGCYHPARNHRMPDGLKICVNSGLVLLT